MANRVSSDKILKSCTGCCIFHSVPYGSVRERSYSRFAAEEAGRLLMAMGAEVKFFNPSGLPLPDDAPGTHPKVTELRSLVRWCDGMVWSSPERHGVMKAQIDWIPL